MVIVDGQREEPRVFFWSKDDLVSECTVLAVVGQVKVSFSNGNGCSFMQEQHLQLRRLWHVLVRQRVELKRRLHLKLVTYSDLPILTEFLPCINLLPSADPEYLELQLVRSVFDK